MTTPIRIVATIEGALNQWCTSSHDAGSGTHGREIIDVLKYEGIAISERSDPKMGKFDGDAITLQIVATEEANQEFTRSARLLTYLSESVTSTGATVFNVRSNTLLTDGSYVHIGTECVLIDDASTLAVDVTRARRDTQAQIHLRIEGEQASEVPIWNRVQAWEGRRVVITAYEFDSSTTVMRGMISQAPYLSADGTMWLIDVEHIIKALDQDVGTPTSVSTGIRGIKFGTTSAFGFSLFGAASFSLVGFYETEQEMLTALGTQLDAVAVSGIDEIWVTTEADGLVMHFAIGASDIDKPVLSYGSNAYGITRRPPAIGNAPDVYRLTSGPNVPSLRNEGPFEANETYATTISAAAPYPLSMIYAVPGTVATDYPWARADGSDLSDETRDASIALADDLAVEVGDVLILSGPTLPEELRITVTADYGDRIYGFSAQADGLLDYCQRNSLAFVVLDGMTTVRVQKALGVGDLGDFLSSVVANAPYANDGTVPYVTSADLDVSSAVVTARLAEFPFPALLDRNYNVTESAPMIDVLAPELQLLGLMLTTDTSGRVSLVPFDMLTRTTPYDITINANQIATPHGESGMWPTWTPSADGVVSVVHLIAGKQVTLLQNARVVRAGGRAATVIDPSDPAVRIYRDIASLSAHKNRGVGMLEIAPEVTAGSDLTVSDGTAIAARIVRFFGQPYEVVTLRVIRTHEAVNARCGDIAYLTSPHVPNSGDGTRGISGRRGLIVGRNVSFDPADAQSASVEFTIIMHGATSSGESGANNIAGYAASANITTATLVSGNTWDCTITQNAYAPSGSDDADFFTIDDYVIAVQGDDATPASTTGRVVSKTATNIRIAFSAAAPWGGAYSGTYTIEFADVSYGMTDPQDDYCYTGDATLLLSTGDPARIFA